MRIIALLSNTRDYTGAVDGRREFMQKRLGWTWMKTIIPGKRNAEKPSLQEVGGGWAKPRPSK